MDWHGKFIEVRRSYKLGRLTPTKARRVEMSDQLIEGLKKPYAQRKWQVLREGGRNLRNHLSPQWEVYGTEQYPGGVKLLLRRAGLREIRLHAIRHTLAILLLSDGTSSVYVKGQLGHNSVQMTVDIYRHLIPDSKREMVNRLDTQPSATYPQHASKEKAHPLEVAPKTA